MHAFASSDKSNKFYLFCVFFSSLKLFTFICCFCFAFIRLWSIRFQFIFMRQFALCVRSVHLSLRYYGFIMYCMQNMDAKLCCYNIFKVVRKVLHTLCFAMFCEGYKLRTKTGGKKSDMVFERCVRNGSLNV